MNSSKKIRSYITGNLIFSFLLASCAGRNNKNNSISILWEQGKATGIVIQKKFLSSVPEDSIEHVVHIHLAKSNTFVLGEYIIADDGVLFRPLIPFTRGLKYEVYVRDKLLGEIEISGAVSNDAPVIVAVYPSIDTLPENLLKFYIEFSKPMQEGEALNHIKLIRNDNDTLSSVFLDLQPELWNKQKTMLTLWLDPGRIKRDLQPNKILGPPLLQGEHYKLLISKNWQDGEGVLLIQDYQKKFFTAVRDSISPDLKTWTVDIPKAGTKEQLVIKFHESLDHVLAENAMLLIGANSKPVKGSFNSNNNGSILYFTPASEWLPGMHTLEVESRLEDLAGNNLNRLFDTDLTLEQHEQKDIFKRSFEIR